jgi:DNA gyrase subunit A
MADDLFPEDPKNPQDPSPQDANSNNPPPAGSPPDGPPGSTVHGVLILLAGAIPPTSE